MARRRAGPGPSLGRLAERFGAAQLNARYQAANGTAMTDDAWAGWFAVKLLWECATRARNSDAQAIQAYLMSEKSRLRRTQGGAVWKFDPQTHVLQQPVYP